MASFNTHPHHQQHHHQQHQNNNHHQHHHQQHHHHQQQQQHPHSVVVSHAADVLSNTSSLAAGGSSTLLSQHQHQQQTAHLPPPLAHHNSHTTATLHNPHHHLTVTSSLNNAAAAAAAAAQQHFERSSTSSSCSSATTTFLVPVTSSALNSLDTTTFLSAAAAASPHFVTSTPSGVTLNSHHHTAANAVASAASSSTSSSSYTFVQIKREPCQVSEVTTSNTSHHHQHHHQQQQQQQHHHHHHHTIGALTSATTAAGALTAASSKTMSSSSTLTTLVKIEASSPKVQEMDKTSSMAAGNMLSSSNNTVPIGIAVARKRPQETTAPPPPPSAPSALTSSSTLPLSQSLNKDMNCFGIRVADLGGVGAGCGNIYFTGNGDLMTSSATADELALNAASLQSVNRASSTFWQYPNALPIESVISMSPATVGLQYSREASRGQVVLLPATATSLGLSNYPILCTPTDPFQQAAAAAFVWPSYIPQGTASATLQPPPNFIFPSMSPHSTLQAAAAAQPYATSLQLLGSNYLTAAAAAAAAAAATSTLCQHNQQTNSTSSSINLSLGGSVVSGAAAGTTMSASSSSTTTRYMSLATAGPAAAINDTGQGGKGLQSKVSTAATVPPTLALATAPSLLAASTHAAHPAHAVPPQPLLIPPSALKIEDWSGADFMAAASKTTTTTLTAAAITVPQPPAPPAHFESRDKHSNGTTTTTNHATNLLEFPPSTAQALNLMRLPTPPASATMETAAVAAAAAAATAAHQLPPLLFQAANPSPTPALLNLSATLNRVHTSSNSSSHANNGPPGLTPVNNTNFLNAPTVNTGNAGTTVASSTLNASIGPPTPVSDDMSLNFKSSLDGSSPQIVVGVPRVVNPALPSISTSQPPPQMQDVNIQTDTPMCSEDENSSCPMNQTQCGTVEPCTTAQCTPPLTQNDELYNTEAQQPLELTKPHRPPSSPQVESSSLPTEEEQQAEEEEETNIKCSLKQSNMQSAHEKMEDEHHSVTPAIISSSTVGTHSSQEDLTGLELLSNISTSSLVKSGTIRVKQEPMDPVVDQSMCHVPPCPAEQPVMESNSLNYVDTQVTCDQLNSPARPPDTFHNSDATPPPRSLAAHQSLNLSHNEVESLGGLSLLCALVEQRIQEEEEVQSTTLNNTNGLFRPCTSQSPMGGFPSSSSMFPQQSSGFVKPSSSSFQMETQSGSTFPSLDSLELPTTSGNGFHQSNLNGVGGGGANGVAAAAADSLDIPVKRKKHKHSKSSKSSSSNGSGSKKSQKCGKKNKKKYSKEKKRHKLLAEVQQTDLDFDDPQLQQELQTAFQNCADPNYQRMGGGKWPTPQEIFSIMENSMRIRLADITRQYRKKKRKLDEISKNKKNKKKCSKLQAAAQQLSLVGSTSLSSLMTPERTTAAATTSSLTSSPLCDYKFGKFSAKSSTTPGSTNYLAPSSFIRFATDSTKSQSHHLHHQTHPQFPPPPDLDLDMENVNGNASSIHSSTAPVYKPVRLEPSSLAAASCGGNDQRSSASSVGATTGSVGILRLAQKHASSEKLSQMIVCKERKLGSSTSSRRSSAEEEDEDEEATASASAAAINSSNHANDNHSYNGRKGRLSESTDNESAAITSASPPVTTTTTSSSASKMSAILKVNPIDASLMLTQDHLYRKETRVLTDMGGLFYAGIMKPLQPPDVYAITLDGERGNKSHIMSREEIFNDTILEVAPKSVEDVPIGTRLCAYWSQQYRCLYPGRAIESESSDDGVTSQEFVSVEFDDGDSGRIRLQNIRYLLSDYPIVEYNDNPLYSLGKQKKVNANKTPNIHNDTTTDHHHQQLQQQHQQQQHEHTDYIHHQQQHNHLDDRAAAASNATTNGSHKDYHQATAMEIFAAKRSEKKRNKSLKKKSQNSGAINKIVVANVTSSSSASMVATVTNGSVDTNTADAMRKHHKHKKRKKHKKHRKNLMEIGIVSELEKQQQQQLHTTYNPSSATFTITKTERTTKTEVNGLMETQLQQHHVHSKKLKQQQQQQQLAKQKATEIQEQYKNNHHQHYHNGDSTHIEDSQMTEDGVAEKDDEEDNEENEQVEELVAEDNNNINHKQQQKQRHKQKHSQKLNLSRIKHETGANNHYHHTNHNHNHSSSSSSSVQNNIKVKTEHLEMEEESTSNLMSEISDEAKADDMVEHNNSKGSKIAAFLPERQLWGWLGTAYCKFGSKGAKGRMRKQFYKTIKRGKETITVGDCAVFLSTGRPDRPYIGRIESMWENSCNNKIVRVRWFYHPEETTGCPTLKYPGALFESPHEDENDVQTISHRCEVLPFARYYGKFGADSKQYQSIYDNNDTYYLAGYYNPRLQVLKLQDNIPTLEEQQQQQLQQQLQQQEHLQMQQQKQNITNANTLNITNNTNSNNLNNNTTNN